MTQSMPSDAHELLRELLRRTSSGDIQWQTAGDGTTFVLTTSSGTVSIESEDKDGSHPYILALLTPDGVRADGWRSIEAPSFEMTPYGLEMGELYEVARRSAKGSTQLVRSLLKDIREPDIPF
jgi:hypothetical protein